MAKILRMVATKFILRLELIVSNYLPSKFGTHCFKLPSFEVELHVGCGEDSPDG